MPNIMFLYDNLWKDYDVTSTTEHPNFPAENTKHRDFNKPWKSLYGAGSGWGRFVIRANINDRLDFEEGAPPAGLAAVLTPGTYDADTLCAHLKAQMEAVGGSTYTWEYIEAGADANKFKVTSDGVGGTGLLTLRWQSGANAARSIGSTIGFDVTVDDAGALTYTADYIRIHTSEILRQAWGQKKNVYAGIIKGHNFQSGATVYFQGSNDDWVTVPVTKTFTIQDDILVVFWELAQKVKYVRFWMADVDNPDLYIKAGVCFAGGFFRPTRNFVRGQVKPIDPSDENVSEDGQITTIQHSKYETRSYIFEGTSQLDEFDAMFQEVGTSKPLFIIENPNTPLSTVKYIQFTNWDWSPIPGGVFWNLTISYKELV